MNSTVSIKEANKMKIDDKVHEFLNPDYLYIPFNKDLELAVKTNSTIYKEQVLLKNDKDFIYSPISGKVLGKTDSMKLNNKDIECIVIENDFKEKVNKKKGTIKYINEYTKEEAMSLIRKYNACDEYFPENPKVMIINGIDRDPYEKTSSLIINEYSSKILEATDALAKIFNIENTIFAINNNDSNNVINLTNNIGTYPNITLKLMPDIYPIGFKEVLLKNLQPKNTDLNEVLYLTVLDVYNIYNVLRRKKPITERLITISGNAVKSSMVINVKIGTSLSDLIKNVCEVTTNKYYVVTNGLIAGKTLTSLNSVITTDTRSIFLNTKDKQIEKKCINCGLCNSKCPVGLNPKYIKEHKKADRSKCINCGLCTYICPSKINFKTCLGDNNEE